MRAKYAYANLYHRNFFIPFILFWFTLSHIYTYFSVFMTFLFFLYSVCNFIKRAHVLFCYVRFGYVPCCFYHSIVPNRKNVCRAKNIEKEAQRTNHPTRNIWKCCTHIHFCWIGNQVVCNVCVCIFSSVIFPNSLDAYLHACFSL